MSMDEVLLKKSEYHQAVRELRRTESHVYHRIRSIMEDKNFVDQVTARIPPTYPIIGNLRCGTWYFPKFFATSYFKSTDGHYGHWQFHISRLNFHVAVAAYKHNGVVIIDSTRKGKKFPDSFTRTIPIWCAIMNTCVLQASGSEAAPTTSLLHMPPWVSDSEVAQVQAKLPQFVRTARDHGVDWSPLVAHADKPLRCVWVTNCSAWQSRLQQDLQYCTENNFVPVVLLSCSNSEPVMRSSYTYIQGAGDDHTSWSLGLTPALFWEHATWLLEDGIYPDECEERVHQVVSKKTHVDFKGKITDVAVTSGSAQLVEVSGTPFWLSECLEDSAIQSLTDTHAVVVCQTKNCTTISDSSSLLSCTIPLDSKMELERSLVKVLAFTYKALSCQKPIAVVSISSGVAVGLVVALLCTLCVCDSLQEGSMCEWRDLVKEHLANKQEELVVSGEWVQSLRITKQVVKRVLSFVQGVLHAQVAQYAVPTRNIMIQINRFFMTANTPHGKANFSL
eukprot:TRINITY_DN38954_c0_g1_i1.p1 TRINITY_DN38954_c0_g1~~TRINITY_DN38954_c0_g1_i1.p1  ORF type:complete len:505 (+),score=15.23 TRINITY_DN38954_c0_g1_i1:21-1535(+)